jgi:preprotein translocase subunit SecG
MIVILVIHLMIVLALIGVVLLQRSEGGGLGVGSTGGFLSSRGTANVLTRTTAFLALAFFATSLGLNWIASYQRKPTSVLTGAPPANQNQGAPSAPLAPIQQGGQGGGILNELGGGQQTPPPAPPSGQPAPPPQ